MKIFEQFQMAIDFGIFGVSAGLALLASIIIYSIVVIRTPRILLSVSFIVGTVLILMYQLPTFLFSKILVTDLDGKWLYFLIINSSIIVFLIFGLMLGGKEDYTDANDFINGMPFYVFTIAMAILSLLIYVNTIGYRCTAMYALIFSPDLLLLSREFGLKIIGGSFATYAVGAYLNFLGPLLFSLSIIKTFNSIVNKSYIISVIYALLGLAAILMGLIVGVKGVLLNFALYSVFMTLSMRWISLRMDAYKVFIICVLFFASLISLEIYKEIDSSVGGDNKYDFPSCVSSNDRCTESIDLLNSLYYREFSLGLSFSKLNVLQSKVLQMCGIGINTPFEFENKNMASATLEQNRINEINNVITLFERVVVYFKALFNRIFVMPFQVSLWHFMKAQENTIEGKFILPLSGTLFDKKINVAEIVYQEYAIKYNGGDKTSTGSAPTTYLLSYPFYAGLLGFVIAITLTFAIDLGLFLLRKTNKLIPFKFYFSVSFVLALNLNVSEFITVMFSHGGFASLFFLIIAIIFTSNHHVNA